MTNSDDGIQEKAIFIKHFSTHVKLLLNRYVKYQQLEKVNNDDIDVGTYFDIIIVQLRALCIESQNLEKNYTVQNALRKFGKNEYADRIDELLDEPFLDAKDKEGNTFTTRKALKILADKFICHYDNFDNNSEGWGMGLVIEKRLMNPFNYPNLDSIVMGIVKNINEGFEMEALVKKYENR